MMLQRLVFAVALGLLATAGGIALTPRVALNTRPQLRFAHAAPAPLGCAPSNFAPSTRCAPPKMQEAAAWRRWARRSERKWFPDAALAALCSR